MEFQNERQSDDVIFDLDLTAEEHEQLVEYAQKNMTQEEVDALLINWSVVDLLTKAAHEQK